MFDLDEFAAGMLQMAVDVTEDGAASTAASRELAAPAHSLEAGRLISAAVNSQWKKPVFEIPRAEVTPTLKEAIEKAVATVLAGNHKATVEKRTAIVKAVSEAMADIPVFGVELADARTAIGEPIELDNATVYVDGYGRAVSIEFDESYVHNWGGQ